MADLTAFLDIAIKGWFDAFIVFVRVGAMVAILPAFGERSIPERIRLVIALAFTMVVYPALIGTFPSEPPSLFALLLFVLAEAIAGLLLGLSLRLFVMALQIAGTLIGQSTSLSQIFGGSASDAQPAMGHILLIGGLALAVMLGIHIRAAELIILSYEVIPAGKFASSTDTYMWGVSHIGRVFSLSFSLAAPFVIGSLIYNVALGVINRAMPQLMVAFVGAPAITFGGILLFFVTAPLLLQVWQNEFIKVLANPFEVQ